MNKISKSSDAVMRNHTADTVKAILILLVVFGHIFTERAVDNDIKGAIYLFHMPVFLGWSGYFFGQSNGGIQCLWKRAWPRYLRPWLIANLVFLALLWMTHGKWPAYTLAGSILDPWFHLWYIPCLFGFAMAFAAWQRSRVCLLLIFMAPHATLLLGVDLMQIIGNIDNRYIYYGLYFAIGVLIREAVGTIPFRLAITILAAGALGAAATFWGELGRSWLTVARCAIVFGVISAMDARPGWQTRLGSSVFATENLAIYLYHYAAIMIIREVSDIESVAYWPIAGFASLVIVPLLIKLIRRWPANELLLGPRI
ncbi:acyltransferase family protein [Rhizobium rhizophilum]|uniref:Acyltransferase 3 domain-containing protein n=1 Tax=Rhizobium rhizophilum TaxID=1850373 RepID=A0ABY2QP11_9HYPH|nr:acyltransferase family protein [Rhizobium rhizophilum]THV10577.1 hypothetical protein E9677_22755 [Rhizobium rhizophilum]